MIKFILIMILVIGCASSIESKKNSEKVILGGIKPSKEECAPISKYKRIKYSCRLNIGASFCDGNFLTSSRNFGAMYKSNYVYLDKLDKSFLKGTISGTGKSYLCGSSFFKRGIKKYNTMKKNNFRSGRTPHEQIMMHAFYLDFKFVEALLRQFEMNIMYGYDAPKKSCTVIKKTSQKTKCYKNFSDKVCAEIVLNRMKLSTMINGGNYVHIKNVQKKKRLLMGSFTSYKCPKELLASKRKLIREDIKKDMIEEKKRRERGFWGGFLEAILQGLVQGL